MPQQGLLSKHKHDAESKSTQHPYCLFPLFRFQSISAVERALVVAVRERKELTRNRRDQDACTEVLRGRFHPLGHRHEELHGGMNHDCGELI